MRKVLSFVLVLALVLSSFSMAFADDATATAVGLTDIGGIANEDAVQVCNDLGIVTGNPDGTYLPEKAVNRAEFAAMITRALGIPESALAGYTNTGFKDTTGYTWAVPYLAFCESKGIMLGDGQGNAMPGRTINTNEAVTMALRAIGYTANSAELVGVWPSNYVTKAQDVGIYDDVAAVTTVDKANAAQIIYNTLTVQKVAVNSDGQTNFLWEGGVANDTTNPTNQITLLTSGLDCDANPGETIDADKDAVINIVKYLGQYGTTYTNSDEEIVAFICDSTELIGTFSADNKTFTTTVGEVDYTSTAAFNAATAEFYNGTLSGTVDYTGEVVLNVKLSGKKVQEVYSALTWEISDADVVDADQLKDIEQDDSLLGSKFALDDDDNIDLDSFVLVGAASLDKIAADNVVYVYENNDNKISKIEVGTETAEGVISNFKSGDTPKFNIGSTTYYAAYDKVNGADTGALAVQVVAGDVTKEVKASLDVNGYVYDFEEIDGGNKNIAVVEKYADGIDDQVKIFESTGSSSVHTYDAAKLDESTAIAGTVIAYSLNKDGKITDSRMDATSSAAVEIYLKSNTVANISAGSIDADMIIASDVVVFAQEADGDYKVVSIDKIEKETPMTGSVLFNNDDKKVVGLLVPDTNAKASSDDVYGVINDLYTTDLDGDMVDRLVGFADGVAMDKIADGQYFTDVEPNTTTDAATDFADDVRLYKFEMDADGNIVGNATPVADDGVKIDVVSGVALSDADGRNSVEDTTGTIYALADDVVVYEVNSDKEYVVYSGSFKAKDVVVLYNFDTTDSAEYDVVILNRADR